MISICTCIIVIHGFFFSLAAIDNVHFYRPNFFWGEPRLECPWLTTIDVAIATGKTRKAHDSRGKKTNLFNIYGLQNMHKLADNVPNLSAENPLDAILINLNAVPEREHFGQLKLKGNFHIIESSIDIYQNIKKGFFFQMYIPARQLRINPQLNSRDDVSARDLSPIGTIQPNKNTPEWQAFLANFFSILRRHNLSVRRIDRSGLGDISVLAGWTCSCQHTIYLDFIDVAAKIGVLFPTGKKQDPNKVFDLPQGYDGHWGVPLKFDASIGLCEWFTCGIYIGSLFLADRTKKIRMRTSEKQNSFIKLMQGEATVDPGIYFDFSTFVKADHFCKGLSILIAYSFNFKESDAIEPKNKSLFNKDIVNNDLQFASWNQHIIHVEVDYDFAQKITDVGRRIGFFYNRVVDGKRIFRTHTKGGALGIDFVWCF